MAGHVELAQAPQDLLSSLAGDVDQDQVARGTPGGPGQHDEVAAGDVVLDGLHDGAAEVRGDDDAQVQHRLTVDGRCRASRRPAGAGGTLQTVPPSTPDATPVADPVLQAERRFLLHVGECLSHMRGLAEALVDVGGDGWASERLGAQR